MYDIDISEALCNSAALMTKAALLQMVLAETTSPVEFTIMTADEPVGVYVKEIGIDFDEGRVRIGLALGPEPEVDDPISRAREALDAGGQVFVTGPDKGNNG